MSLNALLQNSMHSSIHKLFGCLCPTTRANASVTDFPVLSFRGKTQAYLLNTSITVNKYFTPLLFLAKACLSTKSADYVSFISVTVTQRVLNLRLNGLCNSSANLSVHFISETFFLASLAVGDLISISRF